MAIDRFSRDRFEEALPKHKITKDPLWHDVGFLDGEFVYGLNVWKDGERKVDGTKSDVTIFIRSSIDMDGFARETGADSIRLFFMREGKPWGSKISCYITRVKGWEERLTKQLRIMYKRGMSLNTCPICHGPKAMYKKKDSKDLFQACPDHFKQTYENYVE